MFIWTSVLLSYSQVPGNTAQPTICPSSIIVRCLFNSLTSMMDWQICFISARYIKIHFLLGATFCLLACFCFLFFAFQLWEVGPAQEVSGVFRATAPGKGGASWAFPCIPIWAAAEQLETQTLIPAAEWAGLCNALLFLTTLLRYTLYTTKLAQLRCTI